MKPLGAEMEAASEVRAPTRRALAKQQTRAKVLTAARTLFSTEGYEGATIRDIAAAAGMSTGAVFANFADKSDLFREIMIADVKALAELMQSVASQTDAVEDALLKVFMAGYDFYKARMPLARAAFSVSWSPDDGPMLRNVASRQPVVKLIAALLEAGVARGELSEGQEAPLRAQMLFDCYLANFVQAIFAGWSEEALRTRSRDQIRIVLAGARHS